MDRRVVRIVLLVVGLLLALGAIVGAVVYLGRSQANKAGAPASGSPTATTLSAAASSTPAASTAASPVPEPAAGLPKPAVKEDPSANDVTHQATRIMKMGVADGGASTVTLDYVQFLTGAAADKAAKAHGTTVENDYYIVNDNKKLRVFPVASDVAIVMHPGNGPQYSRDFTLAEFKSLVSSGEATYDGQLFGWDNEATYYVDVKNGKVVRIENLWTP
jgi:hypothetical protein